METHSTTSSSSGWRERERGREKKVLSSYRIIHLAPKMWDGERKRFII